VKPEAGGRFIILFILTIGYVDMVYKSVSSKQKLTHLSVAGMVVCGTALVKCVCICVCVCVCVCARVKLGVGSYHHVHRLSLPTHHFLRVADYTACVPGLADSFLISLTVQ